jgi:hypothetical protein
MSENKDYNTLSRAELEKLMKQLKGEQKTANFIMGFCVGVMVFGYASNGFGWVYTLIPLLIIGAMYKSSHPRKEKMKELEEALSKLT